VPVQCDSMRAPVAVLLLTVAVIASTGSLHRHSADGASGAHAIATEQDPSGSVPPGSLPLAVGAALRWRHRQRRLQTHSSARITELRARFSTILGLLAAVIGLGTAGYMLIEHWDAFDSLYMTVITVASVGYGEVHPLSVAGRAFTIALIVFGLGTVAYGLTTITALWVEGNLLNLWENRRMERRIGQLQDHIVICGGGETGRNIARELMKTSTPFVIIDIDPKQEAALQKFGHDVLYVIGDATDDDMLRAARIETAHGLIAAMPSDKDNLFTLLTAREINPRLRLVSAANSDDARSKLLRAGADAVVSGKVIGALRMQEIPVGAAGAGRPLGSLRLQERVGVVVFALVSAKTRHHQFNPPPDTTLETGDVLIVCASRDQVVSARQIVEG
jgi:voltage-gated potassium channel